MFKKLLSTVSVMLFAFCMNAGAQALQVSENYFARKSKAMSKIELNGDEFWWGHFNGDFTTGGSLGMGKNAGETQHYDAAMAIEAGSAVGEGKTIKGISFSFPNSTKIENVKIWISNALPSTPESASVCCKAINKADITGMESYEDYVNEIRFDEPYKIDPAKDTYIGYSFDVLTNESDEYRYPIFITGQNFASHPKGLLINVSGEEGKWEDYEQYHFGDLAVRILMSGDFDADAAGIKETFAKESVVKGGTVKLPIEIQNAGVNGIQDVTFEIDINGEKQVVDYTPEYAVEGISTKHALGLEITAPETLGLLPVTVTVTKVNGVDNAYDKKVAKGNIIVVSEKVQHKVVVEEFTALWCGWCPRGFVALENLRKDYGDNIVLAAAHINDQMDSKQYYDAIQPNQPAPSAHIDRRHLVVDPYYGQAMYAQVPMAIKFEIDDFAEMAPEAAVKVDATLDGNKVIVKSDIKFLYSGEANYALGYVLTEDGLQDETWEQSNYYSNLADAAADENLKPWTEAGNKVTGLVFNDVVIAAEGIKNGIKGSIPATVEEGKTITHEQTFDLSSNNITQNKSNISALVYLFDVESGKIVNANFIRLSDSAAIEGVEADGENAEEVARYTIDGRRIYSAEKGVNLVKFSDGTVKKVIVK